MFSEFVKDKMEAEDKSNSFLTHGIMSSEEYQKMMYLIFKKMIPNADVTFEEFKQTPSSLAGYHYPTKKEMETLAPLMQELFDVMDERVNDGKVMLFRTLGMSEDEATQVKDAELIAQLESEPTFKVYRAMALIDGKLYSPMATMEDKKTLGQPIELGKWEQADERPDKAFAKKNAKGEDVWYYNLIKDNGDVVPARYNPYIHTSYSPLNDQFSTAYKRPNLVTVEVEVPVSELTSGYKADKAKDAVGEVTWKSGPVSGKLAKVGDERRVVLSRYDKPVRIVPDAEVAQMIAEKVMPYDIAIPSNTVTPWLRGELEKLGVRIEDTIPMGAKEYAERGMDAKRGEAERLSQKFNTPVRIVSDVAEIADTGNARRTARMRNAKGWYDPVSGEVVVVLPNHKDVGDVAETVLHEVVGHKGLRELVGEENYEEFLGKVYEAADEEVRQRIGEIAAGNGYDYGKATDEYLARLAEKGFEDFDKAEKSLWKKLKQMVMDAINKFLDTLKLPKWVKLTDNELRYMLWRSAKRMERGKENYVEKAEDIAKRSELGLDEERKMRLGDERGTFADRQQAAVENKGTVMPGLNEAEVNVVNVPRHNYGGSQSDARDAALEDAKKKYVGRELHYDNHGTSFDYEITGKSLRKSVSGKAIDKSSNAGSHIALINHLDEVIGESIEVEEHADYTKQDGIRSGDGIINDNSLVHRFYGVVNIDGEMYRVKTTMIESNREGQSNYPYTYEVINAELLPSKESSSPDGLLRADNSGRNSDAKVQTNSETAKNNAVEGIESAENKDNNYIQGTGNDVVKVSDLLKDVEKSYDKGVMVLDESENDYSGMMFRDGGPSNGAEVAAMDSYNRMMQNSKFQFSEAMQDSMLSLKELYKAILQNADARIEDVKGYENAYLAENRMSSASEAQIAAWQKDYYEPIVKAVSDLLGKRGIGNKDEYDESYRVLLDYMMAKHGLERNVVMAERDARMNSTEDVGDYEKELEKNRQRDYAGLTALTDVKEVGEAEVIAQQMVDDYEATHDAEKVNALWDAVHEATRSSLWKTAESGLISGDRYKEIRDMYEYYIPLQGFDSKVAEDVYAYMGSDGTMGYGIPIRRAKGRKSKADDPLATISMNGEAAIRQGNRNVMKQHFLRFVQSHPSDLVSVSDVWLRKNDVTGEWEHYFDAGLMEDDSAADVRRKVEDFNKRMAELAEEQPETYKRGKDLVNVPYRVLRQQDMDQHVVRVMEDGKSVLLTINGSPRAAQALNGMTNPDVATDGVFGKAMNIGEKANRALSALYTTRNPEFVVSNFIRDAIYSNCMSWVKENGPYAWKFHKNFGKANPATMTWLFAEWESGKLREKYRDGNVSETEKLFYDFMMNGGETGWTNMRDIEKHKKDLQKSLAKEKSTSAKAWKAFEVCLDLMNRSVENCARFAAFVTSREMGRSMERSVYDAKEVSVNFNKKGAGDKFLGAKGQTFWGKTGAAMSGLGRGLFVFWNAGVQALNNIGRAAGNNPKKFMLGLVTSQYMLGVLMPLLNEVLLGGDDEDKNAYYNLPEYIRRSNLCFRLSNDMPWITIPLPIEFRAIYGLGELTTGVLLGKERYTGKELTKQIISQVSQVLPLDFMEGGGGTHALIPSAVKPFVEASRNKSWTGLPIYKDTPYNQDMPEWTKAYTNADNILVESCKWMNEKSGGDEYTKGWIDFNPSKIEYVLKGMLGGPYTMYNRMEKSAETIFGEREFEWKNVPIASRIIKEGDERTEGRKTMNQYFDLKKEYEDTKRRLNSYDKKIESGDEAEKYEERKAKLKGSMEEDPIDIAERISFYNYSPEYKHYIIMDNLKPVIDAYYEYGKSVEGEDLKKVQEAEREARRRLVNVINAVDNGEEVDLFEEQNAMWDAYYNVMEETSGSL